MNRKRQHVFITEERKLARNFAINVGYLIQHVRASKRLDQTELAERVGTSRATISRLERGKSVASETILTVLAELDMLKSAAFEVAAHADGERFYRRKPTGPSDAERQQKWQEFERYWLGETNGY